VKPLAAVSWSGGKDCCLALYRVRDRFQVRALLTMLIEDGSRTRSHGIRPEIIRRHAESLGAKALFGQATWQNYEEEFVKMLQAAADLGVTHVIFGDVFPDAHRQWVEGVCARAGVEAVLPLWAGSTRELAAEFLAAGGQAQIVTVRESKLDPEWLGRTLSPALTAELESLGVDPCGEYGEFHTLVTSMPGLLPPMRLQAGARIAHADCWLLDLELYDSP
jgi:diphthine-ammonia ligase